MYSHGTGNFTAGLDLGSATDYSALVIAEHVLRATAERQMMRKTPSGRYEPRHEVMSEDEHVVHLVKRWPLGTPFSQVLVETAQTLDHPTLRAKVHLRSDRTGLGAPIGEMIYRMRVDREPDPGTSGEPFGHDSPSGIVTTAGREPGLGTVPKRDLVTNVERLLQRGLLTLPEALPLREELEAELKAFEVRITNAGNATFEASSGQHDDMVLALAYALYGFGHFRFPLGVALPRWRMPDGEIEDLEPAGHVASHFVSGRVA